MVSTPVRTVRSLLLTSGASRRPPVARIGSGNHDKMKRHFEKMHGLGNDFVIIDARTDPVRMTAERARAIAHRRTGIGCDQLIVLEPSTSAEIKMRIWNCDGGEVESCGNATRCVAKLTGAKRIETPGGLLEAEFVADEIEARIPPPRFAWHEIPLAYPSDTDALPMGWESLERPMALNVGNPHLVFFVDDLGSVALDRLGPMIENDPVFPQRINVNVAMIVGTSVELRTWERGSGLTLACGTGACATAVAALKTRRASSPLEVVMPGGSLMVSWAEGESIRMRGRATHVFGGEFDVEAIE